MVETLSRLIETQLFDIRGFDWPTIGIAASALMLVALGAAMVPAWRASQLDPNVIFKAG